MIAPCFLTVFLTTLLAAGSVFVGSRTSENLLGPTGMVGQPTHAIGAGISILAELNLIEGLAASGKK